MTKGKPFKKKKVRSWFRKKGWNIRYNPARISRHELTRQKPKR